MAAKNTSPHGVLFTFPHAVRPQGTGRHGAQPDFLMLLAGKAQLRQIRFHDVRHTFVSLLIEQGAHPKYIQEQAGHSSIQVTMDTYGHLFPSREQGWTSRLDDVPMDGEMAPQTHPEEKTQEQESSRLRVRTKCGISIGNSEGVYPPTVVTIRR